MGNARRSCRCTGLSVQMSWVEPLAEAASFEHVRGSRDWGDGGMGGRAEPAARNLQSDIGHALALLCQTLSHEMSFTEALGRCFFHEMHCSSCGEDICSAVPTSRSRSGCHEMPPKARGGLHARIAAAAADVAPPPDVPSQLANLLLNQWIWGDMSALQLQKTAAAAVADGADHRELKLLASIGSHGTTDKDFMHRTVCTYSTVLPVPVGIYSTYVQYSATCMILLYTVHTVL